jgi:hypothetical protein
MEPYRNNCLKLSKLRLLTNLNGNRHTNGLGAPEAFLRRFAYEFI